MVVFMKLRRYRFLCAVFAVLLLCGTVCYAEEELPFTVEAKAAVLMEANTGKILYASNIDEPLPPASVTKIMTLLLTMEAIDSGKISWEDTVQVSENAASMGGSQVFLKPGETMSVTDMVKSVVISSANDAAVALSEFVAGSEETFVSMMNARAAELGMEHTSFENTTGLDDTVTNHTISAEDIAIMSRELVVKHPKILEYSSIWMDTIRDGAFGLSNTNRLIRFYHGANGLKTGSTSKAGFCISATAKRDGMQLIAVIMGSPNRDIRNEAAKKLLDYGFSTYSYVCFTEGNLEPVHVLGGITDSCGLRYGKADFVLPKGSASSVTQSVTVPEQISAPVQAGDVIGSISYMLNGEVLGSVEVTAAEDVPKISYLGFFKRILTRFFLN